MRRTKKNSTIHLPLNVTLTDDGKYFFNRRRSGSDERKKSFVGDEIQISTYSAKTLQRLVYAGYVSRIELSRSDFLSKRAEIMDVSKLIAYAILYKKFGMILGRELSDTSLISSWNRKYPQQALNEYSMVGDTESGPSDADVRGLIGSLVRRSVSSLISEDESLSTEEREISRLKAEHFLESLNPLLWRVLMKNRDERVRAAAYVDIEEVLKSFLSKTVIADYLSLLIMELVAYAEMSLLRKTIEDDPNSDIAFEQVVREEGVRKEVLGRLEKTRRNATLAWRIQGQRFTLGKDKATHIVLYNRVVDSRELRREIEESNKNSTDAFGLAEFYSEREGEEASGTLGLSYLSYLEDACAKLGVRFESYVNYLDDLDLTLITLSVRL